jgi:hypothetical protein
MTMSAQAALAPARRGPGQAITGQWIYAARYGERPTFLGDLALARWVSPPIPIQNAAIGDQNQLDGYRVQSTKGNRLRLNHIRCCTWGCCPPRLWW